MKQNTEVAERRERIYLEEEMVDLFEKAGQMGFSLERDSELNFLTIGEIDRLINRIQ